ncbi:MAG: hypothetical protein GY926_19535 [bacterium]|nr:hypothetical protein [bacterium]
MTIPNEAIAAGMWLRTAVAGMLPYTEDFNAFSFVVCDSAEEAKRVLRDHEAMEELRSHAREAEPLLRWEHDPTIRAWEYQWTSDGEELMIHHDDPADAVLAAKEVGDD